MRSSLLLKIKWKQTSQKVGEVLSGTMSHVTMSDAKKLHAQRVGARILIKGKSSKAVRGVLSIIKNK